MRVLRSIILTLIFFVLATPVAFANLGAGTTPGWEPTVDGLTGSSSGYTVSASSYELGNSVTVNATVTNPSTNSVVIVSRQFYAIVYKVIASPTGTSVVNGNPSLSESTLYFNNLSGDAQNFVMSSPVGVLSLNPGQSGGLSFTFTPSQVGYYQVDFADTNSLPTTGRIVAAAFIRVLEPASESSSEDPNDKHDGPSSDGGGNTSGGETPQTLGIQTISNFISSVSTEIGAVLGIAEATSSSQEAAPSEEPKVLGDTAESCSANNSLWVYIWLFDVLATIIVILIAYKFGFSRSKSALLSLGVGVLAAVIWFFNRCTCADAWLCNWSLLVFSAIFVLGQLIYKPSK